MPIFVLLPLFVTETLGRGASWYGFLLAAISGGSIAGTVVAATLRLAPRARGLLLLAILLAIPVLGAALGASPASLALVVACLLGVATGLLNVLVITLVQLATPHELRGRVMGILIALSGAATPLGMAIGGVLGDVVHDLGTLFAVLGVLGTAYVAAMATPPPLREFLGRPGS